MKRGILLAVMAALAACDPVTPPDDTPADGTEGGACFSNGTCDDGLTCASRVCVALPGEGEGEGTAAAEGEGEGQIAGEGEGEGAACDRSVDGDCDGIPTAQDCDDANPAALSNAPVSFALQNAFARTPANVTLFFRATSCANDPVAGLAADAFTVREDGGNVSVFESGQTLLSTSLGFERFTLLLLDMSGSTISSGALSSLLSAAEAFVNATVDDGGSHRVGIQLFDGRADPVEVIDYTNDVTALTAAIDGLNGYVVVDPSTNLNGAVIAGLVDVDARLAASQAGAKSSALVVFTDGTDQTGRATTQQAVSAVTSSPSAVFTVGLGAEIDAQVLRQLGKSGAEFAASQTDIVAAFAAIGETLEREAGGYYILSYCSPKRAGTHTLTVGIDGRPGQTSYTFDATGFTQGCTPDGVSNPCAGRACGVVDGIVCGACAGGESCTLAGQCQIAPSDVCGDGIRTVNEACDDGNAVGGDGCSSGCAIEGGFTCPSQGGACGAICGDGVKRGGEGCDDGNQSAGDGCSSTCAPESGFTCVGQGPGSCVTAFRSCTDVQAANPLAPNGNYLIDPDGSGPVPAATLFCDISNGGLTLVMNLYDSPGDDAPNATQFVTDGWQQTGSGQWRTTNINVTRDASGRGSAAVSLAFVDALRASGLRNMKVCFVSQSGVDGSCRQTSNGSLTLRSSTTGNARLVSYASQPLVYSYGRFAGLAGSRDGYGSYSNGFCMNRSVGSVGEWGTDNTGLGVCERGDTLYPAYNGVWHTGGYGMTYRPEALDNSELRGAPRQDSDAVADPNVNTFGFRIYLGP